MIPFSMLVLVVSSHLAIPVADSVPKFNIERSCQLDREAAEDVDLAQPIEKCIADEKQAKQQLEKDWPQFSASDRASCVADTMTDETPSYVELQICLDLAREAQH
jgi:hypothetical protein